MRLIVWADVVLVDILSLLPKQYDLINYPHDWVLFNTYIINIHYSLDSLVRENICISCEMQIRLSFVTLLDLALKNWTFLIISIPMSPARETS